MEEAHYKFTYPHAENHFLFLKGCSHYMWTHKQIVAKLQQTCLHPRMATCSVNSLSFHHTKQISSTQTPAYQDYQPLSLPFTADHWIRVGSAQATVGIQIACVLHRLLATELLRGYRHSQELAAGRTQRARLTSCGRRLLGRLRPNQVQRRTTITPQTVFIIYTHIFVNQFNDSFMFIINRTRCHFTMLLS